MERNDFLTNTCTRSWDCTSLNERRGNGSWANVCESLFKQALSESRVREIRPPGLMSGVWKRSMARH